MHIQLKLCTNRLDVPETLLIVRSSAADPNLDLVLDKSTSNFSKRTNNTLESRSNLKREVSHELGEP